MPSHNFSSLGHQSYMVLSQKLYEAMKACASLKSTPTAQKLHAQLITTGLDSSVFLLNHLMNMYSNCGLIDDASLVFGEIELPNVFSWNTIINGLANAGRIIQAEQLFGEMPQRDAVSWNSMMSGYVHNGKPKDTIKCFASMIQSSGCIPDPFSFSCVMKACSRVGYVKLASQLHGLVEKFDFGRDDSVESSIIDMYIKCDALSYAERVFLGLSDPNLFCWNSMLNCYSKLYGVKSAFDLFNQMPERDTVSWNTMISLLSHHGYGVQTLHMFVEMWFQGFRPNSMTYASVLSACASVNDLEWGVHLHARIIRVERSVDVYIGSGLIDMYAKCGCLKFARTVFDNLTERNAVSWTSLIAGVAQSGQEEEALALFKQMGEAGMPLDEYTLATMLGICSTVKFVLFGAQLHAHTIKVGMDSSTPVGNALVTMYTKCGNAQAAKHAFDLMPMKDIISWTAMITAFSQTGDIEIAREYFDKMPERNVITWNSMLATYMKHGFWEEGFKLYILMLKKEVKPDWITFTTLISACADSAILRLGEQIIVQAEKFGFCSSVTVANTVLTMYARCGQIGEAQEVFDSLIMKDLVTWNAMMAGYAQSGQGRKVIEVFEEMLSLGFTPDHISYVSVLSGCSHSGLVPEGLQYFGMMTKCHFITPTHDHYACMVDLLGRARLLDQAKALIDEMPFQPNAAVWGALLGACRMHGNTKLAEIALKSLIELDVGDSGSYVLLANIYLNSGKLKGVSDVRKLMREKGVKKNPGCSWIEIDNRVHVFTVDETNHPQIKDIYRMLEEIMKQIEDTGRYIYEAVSGGYEDSTARS